MLVSTQPGMPLTRGSLKRIANLYGGKALANALLQARLACQALARTRLDDLT